MVRFAVLLLVLTCIPAKLNGCDVDDDRPVEAYAYVVHNYTEDQFLRCECDRNTCVRKCCAPDFALEGKRCVPATGQGFGLAVYDGRVEVLAQKRIVWGMAVCAGGMYKLNGSEEDDEFFVQVTGKLWQTDGEELVDVEDFCVEASADGGFFALVCFPEAEAAMQLAEHANALGMIVSMPFLLLTFTVYALLPDRNLHGKALMCYVISLFGAYVILVSLQLNPGDVDGVTCRALGLTCLFFFMSSFFWMNVMSIDIWWAFSGLRGFSGSKKQAERKRFLLYSAYAWGVPILQVTLVTLLMTVANLHPYQWYNPGFGDGKCWFKDELSTLVYFYGPMAALIVANIILFVITALKIKHVQQETAMLRKEESKKHSYENDKQRFNLYLKLMLAMGVNWSMEIISWAVNWQIGTVPPPVWYLTDFCNALYGVFIFLIFVCKRNIWKLLKRRYYLLRGKPHLARSMTQNVYSPRTTTSTMSQMTVTTDAKAFANDSSVLTSEVP